MSLHINLLELKLNPLTRITAYRRRYEDGSVLDEIREQLGPDQFVTRLGDRIWGYSLSEQVVEQYEFAQVTQHAVALEPRFMNRLLRQALTRRLEHLGFQRAGRDRFELPGDVAFPCGEGELVAKPRWLVRPFSLPSHTGSVFTLLVNPRLTYKFKTSLAQLSGAGFHWMEFGNKVRALTAEQDSQGNSLWENAHTALVIEDRGTVGLLCQWRDGKEREVSLAECWPLANTENRYRYLRRRYPGYRGEQFAAAMKAKDDDFFALKNVVPRVRNLREQIKSLDLGSDLGIQVGDFLELTEVSHQAAGELQSSLLHEKPEDVFPEELVDEAEEEEDSEEYVQLELF